RAHLRRVQGNGEQRDHARPAPGREAHLPGDQHPAVRHAEGGEALHPQGVREGEEAPADALRREAGGGDGGAGEAALAVHLQRGVPGRALGRARRTMPQLPLMPFVAAALLLASLLPVRLAPRSLGWVAFGLWLLGGVVLLSLGTARLVQAARSEATPAVGVAGGGGAVARRA